MKNQKARVGGMLVMNVARWLGMIVPYLLLDLVFAGQSASAQTDRLSFRFGGLPRSAVVSTPPARTVARPPAILLVLHGGAGSGEKMRALTKFETLSGKSGFIVVYPDASAGQWNDGRPKSAYLKGEWRVDDVAYLTELIDRVVARYDADPKRVYVTGISNGGMMALRLACAAADKIAAAAAVAASLPERLAPDCHPARPVPVMLINGTDDRLVPWDGGYVTVFGHRYGRVLSTGDTAALWRRFNNCTEAPVIHPVVDHEQDGTEVWRRLWTPCDAGSVVALIKVEGGGHSWPGTARRSPRMVVGRTSREIDASREIWEFFRDFRR